MSLSAIIKQAAAVAFDVAGDLKQVVTLYSGPTGTYDADTGTTPDTWTQTRAAVGVLYDSEEQKIGAANVAETRTCIIEARLLDGVAISQECQLDAEGYRWKVSQVQTDPAGATFTFYLYR